MQRDAEKDLAMCEAATLGPWEWEELNRFIMGGDTVVASVVGGDEVTGPYVYLADNDARFITEAREALPYWIQRAQAAEAALRWYADQNNYSIPHLGCSPKVMADRGKRAHNTLNEIEGVK